MGLLEKIQNMFADKRTDLNERFEIVREAVHGTMSNFHMAIDRRDKRTIGLTLARPGKLRGHDYLIPDLLTELSNLRDDLVPFLIAPRRGLLSNPGPPL